ncbi:DUF3048 domain-containing protein [Lacrimispora sp. NSJ-141]|uniref:DUF3048 domain-containing protein n=1 Tax=Lientehia hominis TaxID=2897778 RepID=A0AAP2RFK3_9FIRM|nr:DUF3048 domain-containing protein [Lientehia hominis]MCD2491016.1 DUF3048 domain-containing protein [Lientehia hominis]
MKRLKKRKLQMGVSLFVILMLLAGCGRKQEETEKAAETVKATETVPETEAVTETAETEPETEAVPEGMVRSYLTGQWVPEEIGRRRPAAVMISNVKAAQPSYGLSAADVIYEAPAEASAVRFVAFFERYDDLKEIGSIRSARTYHAFFQKEFESIFFHYGQCEYARPYLEGGQCDCVNGVTGASEWAYHSMEGREKPHHHFTSGEEIEYAIERMGYDNQYPESYTGHYQFAADGETPFMPDASPASRVSVEYISNKPWFEYNAEDGLYYRYQFEGPHMDAGNDEQLACRNIIIQVCDYEHYFDTDYLNIFVQGEGAGQFITDGKVIPVTWKKDGEWGVTHYYDSQGNEIKLNQGKTWVCIVRTERAGRVQIS